MAIRKRERSILFLGKAADAHTNRAAAFCRQHFSDVTVELGDWGDPLPQSVQPWRGDYIISYLSRWVVPEELLDRAELAINFHAGPPEYPGYGCNAFAIYEDAQEYGVTCHHMAPRVDTGPIIAVTRFPIFTADNGGTLLSRAYDYQLTLFYDIVGRLVQGQEVPAAETKWTRQPFTRKQFRELTRLVPDMDSQEIARRVRATTIWNYRPTLEIEGYVFELKSKPRA